MWVFLTQQQMDCRYRIEAELFLILVLMIVPSTMNGNKKQTSNLKLIIQDQFSTFIQHDYLSYVHPRKITKKHT